MRSITLGFTAMVAFEASLFGAPQSPRQQRSATVIESTPTFPHLKAMISLARSPVYTATCTIVEYGSGMSVSNAINFVGSRDGLTRLPLLAGASLTPSVGFLTSSPYVTAEARMLDSTSRILSLDS